MVRDAAVRVVEAHAEDVALAVRLAIAVEAVAEALLARAAEAEALPVRAERELGREARPG